MPHTAHQPAARQSYDAHRGGNLLSEVSSVICLLGTRSLLSAGFSEAGNILMVRRVEAKASSPAWNRDFLEHEVLNEPLLGDPGIVQGVYFAGEQLLQVPDAMYDEHESERWAHELWSVGEDERVLHCKTDSGLHLLTPVPGSVTGMMKAYFANAKLLPLAAVHLYKAQKQGAEALCTITDNLATATLHSGGKLLWQQAFTCVTPEDATYQLLLACNAHNLPKEQVSISATTDAPYQITMLEEMSAYLPSLRTYSVNAVTHDPDWAPVLTLLYQLYACAL